MNKTHTLQQIDAAQAKLEIARQAVIALPELDKTDLQLGTDNNLVLFAPHDMALLRSHKETLQAAGWDCTAEIRFVHDGVLGAYYFHKDYDELVIYYSPSAPGATCKLVQIGSESRPIFEVTCLEAS